MIVGVGATTGTILIHAAAVVATVRLVRRERQLGRAGTGFWINLAIIGAVHKIVFPEDVAPPAKATTG